MNASRLTTLELGGISFGFLLESPPGAVFSTKGYEAFISSKPHNISITCGYTGLVGLMPSEDDCIFESEATWSAYARDDSQIFVARLPIAGLPLRVGLPYRIALFDSQFTRGKIHTSVKALRSSIGSVVHLPMDYPLGMVLLMCILARHSGLLIHACGIDDGGAGYAFVGSSGAGKSTVARLWNGSGRLLNDDRVVIRFWNGAFRIYGVPWHGQIAPVSPSGVVLKKVFFLQKGINNAQRPIDPAQASTMLLKRSSIPLWDRTATSLILDFVADLFAHVPSYILEFVADRSLVDYVKRSP